MTSRTVILGADGMLGQAFRNALTGREDVAFLGRDECDLLDPRSVEAALDGDASTVVNCAAWTDVDAAETKERDAHALNAEAVARLAEHCKATGGRLVHFSTDYVFPGDALTPYPVDTAREPINAYGRTKAAGEEALEASGADYLLIRTSWLYAEHGKNFPRSIARAALERERLNVVDDQVGRPTSAATLAQAALDLLEAGASGAFHFTDEGEPISWFDFAEAIVERVRSRFQRGAEVLPCRSDEFPRPARRPAYSALDLSKTEQVIGPRPHWEDALEALTPRLLASIDPRVGDRRAGKGRPRAHGGATR